MEDRAAAGAVAAAGMSPMAAATAEAVLTKFLDRCEGVIARAEYHAIIQAFDDGAVGSRDGLVALHMAVPRARLGAPEMHPRSYPVEDLLAAMREGPEAVRALVARVVAAVDLDRQDSGPPLDPEAEFWILLRDELRRWLGRSMIHGSKTGDREFLGALNSIVATTGLSDPRDLLDALVRRLVDPAREAGLAPRHLDDLWRLFPGGFPVSGSSGLVPPLMTLAMLVIGTSEPRVIMPLGSVLFALEDGDRDLTGDLVSRVLRGVGVGRG